MKQYDHKAIEEKWRKVWESEGTFKTETTSSKPKQFILDMFPYPSGDGLHVGHPRGYIATDVYSRMKRMQGYNVLHPMGWDAFGLPAENFAIKNKVHPRVAVEKNIARFKEQLSLIGLDYDWSREINTTDPAFYKWTQWIFIQMFKKGLAYESFEPINWCPSCQTGLANEDVENDGTCERCGTKVEQKPMRQWVLKITDYADQLLQDLDTLPKWPEGVKEAQRYWIGRKEGITISHKVDGLDVTLDAFSAYLAWLYADTYLVIAPEHPLVEELVMGTEKEKEVSHFISEMKNMSEIERTSKDKRGIFTGRYALDPINNNTPMPIWIANFALIGFGTGIIRCSAHDVRDYEFAEKYEIPLKEVVDRMEKDMPVNAHTNAGILRDSGNFSGRAIDAQLVTEMVSYFIAQKYGKKTVTYRMKDWVFSRQRYWGEPIPIVHCEKCGVVAVKESDLPVLLPEVESYEPTGTGESPLAEITDWVNTTCPKCDGPAKRETNTMPQWAGSSWYYLRYIDPANSTSLVDPIFEKEWMAPARPGEMGGVDVYVGGDHATRHLIYARFWHKFLYDSGIVSTKEPFPRLEFLGFILAEDGRKMSKRWKNVVNPDDMVLRFGADAFRLYEMFIGPFENTVPWKTDGVVGTYRFIEKVCKLSERVTDNAIENDSLTQVIHKTIKKVSFDIERFAFNTAVSTLMICVNECEKRDQISREHFKMLLSILAPFAPHISEELWNELGEKGSIHHAPWPAYNEAFTMDSSMTIAVQINGKMRGTISAPIETEEDALRSLILADDAFVSYLKNVDIKRFIYVKGKLVSILI